jgi:hypothetical protein
MFLIMTAGLVAQSGGSSDPEPLSLSVTPTVCLSPCAVRARASVEPDAKNRSLTLIAESQEFRRASTIQLDGDRAARTHSMLFKNLDGGIYRIRVRLEQSGGRVMLRDYLVEVKGERWMVIH